MRLAAIVAKVSLIDAETVRWTMPLEIVYAYEHVHYAAEGFICTPLAASEADLAIAHLLKNR